MAESIGEIIKRERERRGWSRAALAHRAGLTAAYISMLEHGQRPTPKGETLRKLAAALEMSMDELAGAPPPTWEFPADALLAAGLPEEEVADLRDQWEHMAPGLPRRGFRALLLRRAALEAELRDLKRRGGDMKSLLVV